MQISGGNFPPGTVRQTLANVIGLSKLLVLALIIFGHRVNIFEHLQITPPPIYVWAMQNKIYACLITFFVCNAIESNLLSTGAFEISLNGMPIWSKLQSGRIPQPEELFEILNNHMQMSANTANSAKYQQQ
eukprot:gene11145-12317_t